MFYQKKIKPIADVLFALLAIIFTMPICLVLLMVGFVVYNGQPLFYQQRTGYKGRVFVLVKFRSIKSGEERPNKYGEFIRRTKIDELPQLFLILNGKMSLIGPRPLLPDYTLLYTPKQNYRHNVKPGITGLSQALGGVALPWSRRLAADYYYAKNISPALDVYILVTTLKLFFNASKPKLYEFERFK